MGCVGGLSPGFLPPGKEPTPEIANSLVPDWWRVIGHRIHPLFPNSLGKFEEMFIYLSEVYLQFWPPNEFLVGSQKQRRTTRVESVIGYKHHAERQIEEIGDI